MADFWDVGQFKETKSGKTRFVRLGYASEKKGGGFYVHLDCLPLPEIDQRDGKITCQVVIQPAKGSYGGGRSQSTSDEQVPF